MKLSGERTGFKHWEADCVKARKRSEIRHQLNPVKIGRPKKEKYDAVQG